MDKEEGDIVTITNLDNYSIYCKYIKVKIPQRGMIVEKLERDTYLVEALESDHMFELKSFQIEKSDKWKK